MVNVDFNKYIELIFGLMYSVNRDYHFEKQNFFCDTINSYCEEFYDYTKNI